jgi:DHA3 family tetracycline resistance protein-like MFS transporter
MLMSMLLIAFAYGTYSEGYDRLWTKHLLDNATLPSLFGFDSILWFGVMKGLAAILSLIASEVVYRRIKTETSGQIIRVLLIIVMALLVALAAYAQMSSFVALILLFWGIGILRDLYGPLWMAWVNQHIPSEVRATMISATGQMDAFGQIAGGPIVGLVGLRGSTRAAISISGALLLPVVWLYTRALRPAPAPILAEVEVLQTESAQV